MKSKLAKIMVVALAMTTCVPVTALAADTSGSFETSFDLYSPALTVQVPVKANIQVNPFSDASDTGVKQFTVSSNSIDIMNASVDVEKDTAIPVNVTIKASITSKGDDVLTEYNAFTGDATSTKKKVNLNLSEAQTAAGVAVKSGDAAAFDSNKKLTLSKYVVSGDAVYTTPAQSVAITKYSSLLSVDIAGPTTTDRTTDATFSTDPDAVTPTIGSFAVTGIANAGANWKKDDVAVAITYDIKASNPRNISTPTVSPVTFASSSPADVTISVPGIGEATVTDIAVHNDGEGLYGDYIMEGFTVAYASGTATITVPKDNATLTYLAGDDYKTKAQDLIIALSDGRRVVTTLTVN